ncbi:MAG: PhzF family phenazine biosynthesis protein [Haliea sp.]
MPADPQAQPVRQWVATVFAGNPGSGRPLARGNTAMIAQLSRNEIDDPARLQTRARQAVVAETSCFFAGSGCSTRFPVHCFNRTQAIQCCGHGMYAVAGILRDEVAAGTRRVALRTGTGDITAEFAGQDVVIGMPLLGCRPSAVPSWAAAAAGIAPLAVAHAGGEDGYAVWVYASVDQVINLQPAGEVMIANTGRAIIASSWDTTACSGFVLRYFAPQYGVAEDPVTGSAMRIAAEYWRQYSGNHAFQVWQCSATGGIAQLSLDQQYCWLRGSHQATSLPVVA